MKIFIKTLYNNHDNNITVIATTEDNKMIRQWNAGRIKNPKVKIDVVEKIESFRKNMESKGFRVQYTPHAIEIITNIYLSE